MSNKEFFAVFFIGVILGVLFTAGIISDTRPDYKKQAIERGFAKYSEITGKWEWKEVKK